MAQSSFPQDSMSTLLPSTGPQGGWSKQGICRDARYSPSLWEGCPITLPAGGDQHPPAPVQLRVQSCQQVRGEVSTRLGFGLELSILCSSHVALLGLTFMS